MTYKKQRKIGTSQTELQQTLFTKPIRIEKCFDQDPQDNVLKILEETLAKLSLSAEQKSMINTLEELTTTDNEISIEG